jgi:hypothetical protein
LTIGRAKEFKLMRIFFITNLNTFGSNMLLALKSVDFENVTLTKIVHIYVIEGLDA